MAHEYNHAIAAWHLRKLIAENGYDDLAGVTFTHTRAGKIKGLRVPTDLHAAVLNEVNDQIEYLDEMLEQEGFLLGDENEMLASFKRLRGRMRR